MSYDAQLRRRIEELIRERDAYAEALMTSNSAFMEKVKEFSIIKRMGESMRWNLDQQKLVTEFVGIVIDETLAENCSLWLVDRVEQRLVLAAAQGQDDPQPVFLANRGMDGTYLRLGQGAAGWVAKHGQSLLIEDVSTDRRFIQLESEISNQIKSLLCLPIFGEKHVIGVFNMSHPNIGAFSQENARVLQLITDQAGLALTNYFLVETIRDFNKKLEHTVLERTRTLRQSEERYTLAAEAGRVGVWDWNLESDELYIAPNLKAILGYGEDEIENHMAAWTNMIHPDDRPRFRYELQRHLDGVTHRLECEYRMVHRDGTTIWFSVRGRVNRDSCGKPVRVVGSNTDTTKRKRMEERLTYSAYHDELTGLPNRALFIDRLKHSLGCASRRKDYRFAILFLDLDHFKIINDSLGHHFGDLLLRQVTRRLEACVRPGDTVARFGGDEFAILLDQIANLAVAEEMASVILERLQQVFELEGHEVFTCSSIGIAFPASGKETPEELLRDADIALYRAKKMGRARFEVFDKSLHLEVLSRLELEHDLRLALKQDEIDVHYQPIVDLRSGKLSGFEALARWHHPLRGLVPPDEFIPIAEETGLITPISKFILARACDDIVKWQKDFPEIGPLTISVNLSTKQFLEGNLIEQVRHVLGESGLPAERLKLEITESLLMEELDMVKLVLGQLRSMNVKLMLDDFGTGYSSLSYLHRFPLNTVKIDASFVRNMHLAEENLAIVRAIKMLAIALNMEVVAEGIETLEQVRQLRALKCEYGQGYYFSKPKSGREIEVLLNQSPGWNSTFERN
ncbi:EAL domain-containing protein [Sulfidibacter corallicola]|uniref:EAL domain-containing protein n=1 Tax=Sulfidibacter corallicola TaxID=2818388 RepID=A0A8A4TNQ2_SULCO|nr:EAL domain-containing protein [Sulfidibacter corallicola]QTD51057.1 EAL domain-containing protein [Sulfidibacter corallicola]